MNQILGIIPAPVKMAVEPGEFHLDEATSIFSDELNQKNGEILHTLLVLSTGFDLPLNFLTAESGTKSIIMQIATMQEKIGDEGYLLKITPEGVQISAHTPQGVFYGIQTLRQLLPPAIESSELVPNAEWTLPCVDIIDYPRFPYRGYMLDVGRNFFGFDVIKPILDVMALLKMNVFHWHLTEDQGWRIEINNYPKLVEIGSKRKDTQVGGLWMKNTTGRPHEGHYTKKEMKDVVTYAAERYIKVIPEIEMPGHSLAALAAYPELSCTGGPFEVPTRFGVKKDVYCAGKDAVFDFLQGVLEEILEIFPSDIIHIGGDEVPKMRWKKCRDCQARLKAEGLHDEFDLQAYFMNRMASFLASRDRTVMGWNEILHDNLQEGVIGQYWWGNRSTLLKHLRNGRKIVISPSPRLYLDFDYVVSPLSLVYTYEPVPRELEPAFHANIIGIETPLWTEWVREAKRVFFLTFPRLMAVAEIGWTPRGMKDFRSFKSRLAPFLQRLDLRHIGYTKLEKTETNPLRRAIFFLHMLNESKDSEFE